MDVPFEYLAHLATVPVTLDGRETTFVLDSGIGVTLVREGTACTPTGATFTGRRMSGQAVTLPLATVGSLAFGSLEARDAEVGIIDMSGFPPELDHVDGFLSLAFFAEQPFTVDYPRGVVRPGLPEGVELPVIVERDGPSVCVFLPLTVAGGDELRVEVDMGSDSLILDERFSGLADGDVRRVDGVDETGNAYTRVFGRLGGSIRPVGAPELAQDGPDVMFQRIIHDGLVGQAFLRRFAVGFDVAGARMLFA